MQQIPPLSDTSGAPDLKERGSRFKCQKRVTSFQEHVSRSRTRSSDPARASRLRRVARLVCLRARGTRQPACGCGALAMIKAAGATVREPCGAPRPGNGRTVVGCLGGGGVSDRSPARSAPPAADLSPEPRQQLKPAPPTTTPQRSLSNPTYRQRLGWASRAEMKRDGGPVLHQRSGSGCPSTPLRTRCSSAGLPLLSDYLPPLRTTSKRQISSGFVFCFLFSPCVEMLI